MGSGEQNTVQSCIVTARTSEQAVHKARELAQRAVCSSSGKRPCGVCRDCVKAKKNIHPDIITLGLPLDEKGKAKKEIVVEQIRALISDAYVMPNEAERKVYIIENADCMNINAQNAVLKLLEEPPAGAVLLLCAVNVPSLLPTVRSRCTLVSCGGSESQTEEEFQKLAFEYLSAVSSEKRSKLCEFCFANDGLDNRAVSAFIDCTSNILADMITLRADAMGMERDRLMRLSALMDECRAYLKVNTGIKHIFALLMVRSNIQQEGKDLN